MSDALPGGFSKDQEKAPWIQWYVRWALESEKKTQGEVGQASPGDDKAPGEEILRSGKEELSNLPGVE